ncbi:11771_t:CDS:2 [Ambispora gerdemannii]|uniref:11771_t:CDS:1 n=1 Tax=Ambispora gerdemannii TaxID=144530 RepID=A0A9N9H526_9GLOM|nr:11771_t:CDS:2 [Ambispora gerdemannii]
MCKNISEEEICDLAKQLYEHAQLLPCKRSANILREELLKKGEKIKRLPNRYMDKIISIKDQTTVVKIISKMWWSLSQENKNVYLKLQEEIKSTHKKRYPDWKSNQSRYRSDFKVGITD